MLMSPGGNGELNRSGNGLPVCHLTRPISAAITGAGFKLDWLETMYLPKTPRFAGWNEWGAALLA